MILETAAVFIGLYVAGVYHGQLQVMQGQLGEIIKQYPEIKKSADAAAKAADQTERAVNTAAENFRIAQRPWVALDTANQESIAPYRDLNFVVSGVSGSNMVVFRYSINNFGHSPANVDIGTKVFNNKTDYPRHGAQLLADVQKVCDEDRARVKLWPCTIVPGAMAYNGGASLKITKEMWETGVIKPTVIGCIWYRSTIGDTTIRGTSFSGNISMVKDGGRKADDLNPIAIQLPKGSTSKVVSKDDWKVVDVLMVGKAD